MFCTSTSPAKAVSELALGLMLDLGAKFRFWQPNLKSGNWVKKMGYLLQGKTLGIIGLGTIGKELVRLVEGFNFKILAHDKKEDTLFAKKFKIKYCGLDHLLSKSDIITIHLNLHSTTMNLINKKNIKNIKKNSIIINTSRGEIFDEKTLYELLDKNKISEAGIGVFLKNLTKVSWLS